MTSSSQLLYPGACYSGPNPARYQLQMLSMCFCLCNVKKKIMRPYYQRRLLYEGFCSSISLCGLLFPNAFLFCLFQFDKYGPKLDNPFIRHSNVSFFCTNLNVLTVFAYGKSNIWHIWMLPWQHLLWQWLCVCVCIYMLESCMYDCMILFCVSHLPLPPPSSSSPPTPQPCQACPRCSHTQDPSARCKEPSSPRSDPHPLTHCLQTGDFKGAWA